MKGTQKPKSQDELDPFFIKTGETNEEFWDAKKSRKSKNEQRLATIIPLSGEDVVRKVQKKPRLRRRAILLFDLLLFALLILYQHYFPVSMDKIGLPF